MDIAIYDAGAAFDLKPLSPILPQVSQARQIGGTSLESPLTASVKPGSRIASGDRASSGAGTAPRAGTPPNAATHSSLTHAGLPSVHG
jgi:hypothetical protein